MAVSALCIVCRKLDFTKLVRLGRTPTVPDDGYNHYQDRFDVQEYEIHQSYHPHLGTVKQILERQDGCTLCSLISQSLKLERTQDTDWCFASSVTFCGLDLKQTPKRYTNHVAIVLVPGAFSNPKVEPKAEIGWTAPNNAASSRQGTIVQPPENGQLDPFPSSEAGQKSLTEPREILHLQPSSKVIPTVTDLFPKATNGYGGDSDTRFSGRRMYPNQSEIGLFRKWLQLCEQSHGKECSHLTTEESSFQLNGLLVIDAKQMCIVDAPTGCRYVTLSYCWGSAKTLKHTQANSAMLRTPGSLNTESIPATISDAILLVQTLGESYLWVDALCIVQDDPIFCQSQISQMGSIYSQAVFTVIGAAGEDADAGLPGVRPATRKTVQGTVELADMNLITVIDGPYYGGVADSRWVTRAWTMQEKVLSRRRLIFTERQVYWQCRKATWLEEVVLENSLLQEFTRVPGSGGADDIEVIGQSYGQYRVYESLVTAYMRRQLSFNSDILNAFTGITTVLSIVYSKKPFHFGLPQSRFNWALNWTLDNQARNKASYAITSQDGEAHQISFPSWSWTAWAMTGNLPQIKWTDPGDYNLFVDPEIEFYREDINGRLMRIGEDRTSFDANNKFIGYWGQLYDWRLNELRDKWKNPVYASTSYYSGASFSQGQLSAGAKPHSSTALPYLTEVTSAGSKDIASPTVSAYEDERQPYWNPAEKDEFIDSGILNFHSSCASFHIVRSGRHNHEGPSYIVTPAQPNGSEFEDEIRISMGSTVHLPWKKCSSPFHKPTHAKVEKSFGSVTPNSKPLLAYDRFVNAALLPQSLMPTMDFMSDPNYGVAIDNERHPNVSASKLIFGEPERHVLKRKAPDLSYLDEEKGDATTEYHSITADLIIIGRSIQEPKRFLRAMIVEWNEGIAYRIGCASVAENDWVKLTTREWKRVRLG